MNLITRNIFFNVLGQQKNILRVGSRSIKNFGHKREPVPLVTTIWHGALTFTFIGFLLEWNKIKTFLFGDSLEESILEESTESNGRI